MARRRDGLGGGGPASVHGRRRLRAAWAASAVAIGRWRWRARHGGRACGLLLPRACADGIAAARRCWSRGRHLRLSATQGFEERRWLNNEETSAMMLNPQIFRNPHGVLLDDQAFTVDCYSLLVDTDEYDGMMAHSGPRAQQQQFWPYYGSVDHHNPMKREYFAGISKNHAAHRGSDNEEIICQKYEVKGAYRCRRRTILPDNLFAVTGIHPPVPNMMADFLLASSREAILFDSPWNKGILDYIPSAFLKAFVALVKSTLMHQQCPLPSMFNFLLVNPSLIPLLEPVRPGIKNKILVEDIVPCESHSSQKIFCKPGEVGRLKPAFWSILSKAWESGVDLKNLSTHGSYILSSHFDKSTYNTVLSFLGVKSVSTEWYVKCIEGSNLVKEGSWLRTSVGYKPPNQSFLSSSEWGVLLQSGSSFVDIPMIDQKFYQNKLHLYREELKVIGVRFEFQEASAYIGSRLMSMAASNTLIRENVYSLLWLIRFLREKVLSPSELINSVKDGQWMKSTLGYRSPVGCIIYDSDWAVASCISSQPFLDVKFYGEDILTYKPELQLLGVLVVFEDSYKCVIDNFKFSSAAITPEATVLILKCIRHVSSCDTFIRKLKDLKWVKTSVGFRAPNESFLVDPRWECLLKVFDGVPVVDFRFYGSKISPYKEELEKTGLITNLKAASKAIAHLFEQMVLNSSLPKASVLALLACYRQLKTQGALPVELLSCMLNEKWLCTSLGFRSPKDAILFNAEWKSLSSVANLPFIDDGDSNHGLSKEIHGYKDELKLLGVTTEVKAGARFVINGINIPKDPLHMSAATVLSLLGSIQSCLQLHVLDKYYDKKLLDFFSHVFGVRNGPSAEDHCKLWSTWESSVDALSVADCSAFWQFIAKNWSKNMEKLLSACVKVPVCTDGTMVLSKKEDVFIPDDLLLKDLFDKLPNRSLFIWYPSSSLPSMSRAKLNNIYGSIGVQAISKAVGKNDSLTLENVSPTKAARGKVINVGMMKLVLAFLSDPALDISAEERHKIVSCLLDVTVLETSEPITVGYSVKLSSGAVLDVKATRKLRWERESSKLYMQKSKRAPGYKEKLEFATNFADEISQGLLFEKADQIPLLAELIKIGSLMGFHAAAVEYLLKSKNLQLFPEDEEFLNTASLGL
uniref:Uncharacterized protein n=1 Tax=Aegilops tauschii TaxID=37682 RepID=R7W496_AEGTA